MENMIRFRSSFCGEDMSSSSDQAMGLVKHEQFRHEGRYPGMTTV